MSAEKSKISLPKLEGDLLMLRLAREIAIDQYDLDTILERNLVNARDFNRIEKDPRFQKYLQDEIVAWNSATNTTERVKLKAAAMVEEWLPEAFKQLHNDQQPLLHRNDLAKVIKDLGGMGKGGSDMASVGERFSVTINLGSDQKISFQKEVPSKVIEHDEN